MRDDKTFPIESVRKIMNNAIKEFENDSNSLFIGYDKENDESALCVFRKVKGRMYALKMFENSKADRIYNLLTGGM